MLLAARALTRLVGIVVLIALALAGLAAAVFCIQGGHGTLSLPGLASDVHLGELRGTVGSWLDRLQAHGPIATVSALSAAGAILLGLVAVVGSVVPRRERLIVLRDGPEGVIAARRRALGQAATVLAQEPAPVLRANARARPRRGKQGGRLRVRVLSVKESGNGELAGSVTAALAPLTEPLALSARVQAKTPRRSKRASGRAR